MAYTTDNSGMGVVLGILLAVLLAVGGYYFIQSRGGFGNDTVNYTENTTIEVPETAAGSSVPQQAAPVTPDNAAAPVAQ